MNQPRDLACTPSVRAVAGQPRPLACHAARRSGPREGGDCVGRIAGRTRPRVGIHPSATSRSYTTLGGLLPCCGAGRDSVRRLPFNRMDPTTTHIVSVGYQGRTVDELAEDLAAQGVEKVIDVRLNAVSRRPGFSKRALIASLEGHGIAYVHARELGNPRENREGFRQGQPNAVLVYEHVLDSSRERLTELAAQLEGRTVAVLCFEADHSTCHRRVVIERFGELLPGLTSSTTGE